ncbi:hypothetical protein C8024_12720 [Sphingopyxis sp. BSNA05]|uniref:hypothetical protein n=1 Tax=Sphingomonadales TaxID=204457 RepID=UPI000C1DCA98|nr:MULTISPECIES: hypothetical protein [Sphingomonadaceae]ATW04299.1 hypothetical protein CHN51_12700 [Sphingorhabdus sp. YGSMI21]NRD90141.1 hypothetical protein [Sphingopyxis sp. BSNA05]
MSLEAEADYAALAAIELQANQQRNIYFSNSQIFGDPAWQLMLEAYIATTENRCVDLSDLESELCRPASVVARLAAILEAEGYLERCRSHKVQHIGAVKLTSNAIAWCEQCLEFKHGKRHGELD